LQQIFTGAALWAPISLGLQCLLERIGIVAFVSDVTGGWGVRITALGLAGLLGFFLVGSANHRKRKKFRSRVAKAREDRIAKSKSDAKAKVDAQLAEDARKLHIVEQAIGDMSEAMKTVLKRFVDGRVKSIDFMNDAPKEAIVSLEALDWVHFHADYRRISVWIEDRTFELLLRHPELVGSERGVTRRRWDLND